MQAVKLFYLDFMRKICSLSVLLALVFSIQTVFGGVILSGELKKWHKITLEVQGPTLSETGATNPFTDYRLNITFTNGVHTYVVPGYFAADGDAGNSGATSGNVWKVHFTPDATGTWNYEVSFRTGSLIAIDDRPTVGTSVSGDGTTGSFSVAANDKSQPDLRAKGRLDYVNQHYLQWQETGEYYIKGGADAPENLLGYYGFDNTVDNGGTSNSLNGTSSFVSQGITYNYNGDGLHHFDAHLNDWKTGDTDWGSGRGKRIIGAINYLASRGMNVFSFLTMNIGGDGQEVYPYVNYNNNNAPQNDRLVFDCSKLDQWEMVFAHGESLGMYLHFKTQETENDQLLDGGNLGNERKMYYRELMARFGHHLALNWNLGEENDIWQELSDPTNAYVKSYAQYFYDNDPYHHHIVIHTYPGQQGNVYTPCLGTASKLTGTSIQTDYAEVHKQTLEWVGKSALTTRPWVVANDEQGSANDGVKPSGSGNNHDNIRKYTLWGNLMAGGGGVEYYFGYAWAHSDLNCEDWRSRESMWDYTKIAIDFFAGLPVTEMVNENDLVGNSANNNSKYCFAKAGEVYVVYLPGGGTSNLNLSGQSATFDIRWFDTRNGGALQTGSVSSVTGGGTVGIGAAPSSTSSDWAVVLTAQGAAVFPVEWGAFDAAPQGGDVSVTWTTLSESGSDRFAVMRSADRQIWEELGSVNAAGTSTRTRNYQFLDQSVPNGRWFYQLRQIDLNGQNELSSIVEVNFEADAWIWSVGPNPVTTDAVVYYAGSKAQPATFELIAVDGRVLKRRTVSDDQGLFTWDVSSLAAGMYFIKLTRGNNIDHFRLLKHE